MKIELTEEFIKIFDKYIDFTDSDRLTVRTYPKGNIEVNFPFKLNNIFKHQYIDKDIEYPVSIYLEDGDVRHLVEMCEYISHGRNSLATTDDKMVVRQMIGILMPTIIRFTQEDFNAIKTNIENTTNIEDLRETLMSIYNTLSVEFDPYVMGDGFGDDDGCFARSVIYELGRIS